MENRVINQDPVRVVLVQQTQMKKNLFKKVSVDAAAIGDEAGRALTPYIYSPDSISEYDGHGLVTVESLRYPGEEFCLNLQGESLGSRKNIIIRENCIEYGVDGYGKGLAALDGTVMISPYQELPGKAVDEKQMEIKTNYLAFSGSTVIFGMVPGDPRLILDTVLGAAVLEGNQMKIIIPRAYSHIAFFGEELLAVGRKITSGHTEYRGGSMITSTTYLPVFQLHSAKTGELAAKAVFTSVMQDKDGSYRAVVVEGIRSRELDGKGGLSYVEKMVGSDNIYEVTLNERFEEISGHREARRLILESDADAK